jgi:hypothetical protein
VSQLHVALTQARRDARAAVHAFDDHIKAHDCQPM